MVSVSLSLASGVTRDGRISRESSDRSNQADHYRENLNLDSSIQVTDEKYWPPTELDDAVPITPAHVAAPQVQVQGAQAPGNARV